MVIYTPLPPDLLWGNEQEQFRLIEQNIAGTTVQVMLTANGVARVERIISTDPNDFLDAAMQPGEMFNFYQPPMPKVKK